MGVHDVGGDLGAGVGVADGVELVAARDAGASRVLVGVEGSDGLVVCEGIMRVHTVSAFLSSVSVTILTAALHLIESNQHLKTHMRPPRLPR